MRQIGGKLEVGRKMIERERDDGKVRGNERERDN